MVAMDSILGKHNLMALSPRTYTENFNRLYKILVRPFPWLHFVDPEPKSMALALVRRDGKLINLGPDDFDGEGNLNPSKLGPIPQDYGLRNVAHLAIRDDGRPGDGTASNPFDVSTQAKHDALLALLQPNYVIQYGPGTYLTKGWSDNGRKAGDGCSYLGSGINQTTIKLTGASLFTEGTVFGVDYNDWLNFFQVENLTIDCDASNQAKFTGAIGAISAIAINATNIFIRNCRIKNYGTGKSGSECFPVFCHPNSPDFDGQNKIIENCIFEDNEIFTTVTGNLDGCSMVVLGANGVSNDVKNINVVARRNKINLDGDFSYNHGTAAPLVENNLFYSTAGVGTGFYLEPGAHEAVSHIVRDNEFRKIEKAIQILAHSAGSSQRVEIIGNNGVDLTSNFLSASADSGTAVKYLLIDKNRIYKSDGTQLTAASIVVTDVEKLIISDNVIDTSLPASENANGIVAVPDVVNISQQITGNKNMKGQFLTVYNNTVPLPQDSLESSFLNITNVRDFKYVTGSNNGTDSFTNFTTQGQISFSGSGSATSGYARVGLASTVNQNTGTGSSMNFSQPFGASVLMGYAGPGSVNGVARIYFGKETTPAAANSNPLTAKGFGVEIGDNGGNLSFRLFAHNGTTFNYGTWVSSGVPIASAASYLIFVSVRGNGSGGISGQFEITSGNFAQSFTLIPSMTGGPSGQFDGELVAVVVNRSTGTPVVGYLNILDGKLLIK